MVLSISGYGIGLRYNLNGVFGCGTSLPSKVYLVHDDKPVHLVQLDASLYFKCFILFSIVVGTSI